MFASLCLSVCDFCSKLVFFVSFQLTSVCPMYFSCLYFNTRITVIIDTDI